MLYHAVIFVFGIFEIFPMFMPKLCSGGFKVRKRYHFACGFFECKFYHTVECCWDRSEVGGLQIWEFLSFICTCKLIDFDVYEINGLIQCVTVERLASGKHICVLNTCWKVHKDIFWNKKVISIYIAVYLEVSTSIIWEWHICQENDTSVRGMTHLSE